MSWLRKFGLFAIVVGIFSFTTTGTAVAKEGVQLSVVVLHATKGAKRIDPTMGARMKKSVSTVFGGKYNSFKVLSKSKLKLKKGKKGHLKLPTNQKASVTYRGKKGVHHKIGLAIPKHKIKMSLSARAGKLFYQAGIRHKKGMLILAFSVID